MEQTTIQKSNRILAIDILRGITIAGMIMVNNQGADKIFTPLDHAEWLGMTPTDLVFPFFMFIMGMTTYLSLRKFNFEWSWPCARKIFKRAFLLWGIGLALSLLFAVARGREDPLGHLRILGVLPRLGICYGLAALIAISVKHKLIPWLIAAIFIVYWVILATMNGFAHDETNIIAIVDNAILGANHVYRGDCPDPEGILSTLPALGHVLIGFCVGKMITKINNLNDKIERLFIVGALLTFAGFLLSYGCPIAKKLWTPTFAMVSCGLGATTLALLSWVIDKKGKNNNALTEFFHVFGVNPLALYVLSDLLLFPLSMWHLVGDTTIQGYLVNNVLEPAYGAEWAGLIWSLIFVFCTWLCGVYLYKKKIYIKL